MQSSDIKLINRLKMGIASKYEPDSEIFRVNSNLESLSSYTCEDYAYADIKQEDIYDASSGHNVTIGIRPRLSMFSKDRIRIFQKTLKDGVEVDKPSIFYYKDFLLLKKYKIKEMDTKYEVGTFPLLSINLEDRQVKGANYARGKCSFITYVTRGNNVYIDDIELVLVCLYRMINLPNSTTAMSGALGEIGRGLKVIWEKYK